MAESELKEEGADDQFDIVIAVFDRLTQLDFTGPFQVLSLLPGARITVASVAGKAVSSSGLVFSELGKLEEIESCDVLLVPGGRFIAEPIQDEVFMAALRRLAASARYVTSVCTGSIILAAAGLLNGKRAACHWAWKDILSNFGAIPDGGRIVRDGNYMSGAGVSAGIDFALSLASELAGKDVAQMIQLTLEYAPDPPFNAGRPDSAPAAILRKVEQANESYLPEVRKQLSEIAGRLVQK
ncbi:MAG TPA: DJ-1/PfpI family protein [Chroococcales cyanobacterium]